MAEIGQEKGIIPMAFRFTFKKKVIFYIKANILRSI